MHIELTKDIKTLLTDSWASDPELCEKWHIAAPATLEDCVDRTLQDLENTDNTFKVFKVLDGDNVAGFFGQEIGNYLNLFFIHPKYRNKEKVSEIWSLVSGQFPSPFFTAVYSKNSRAINFYSKNGRILDDSDHYKTFILRNS